MNFQIKDSNDGEKQIILDGKEYDKCFFIGRDLHLEDNDNLFKELIKYPYSQLREYADIIHWEYAYSYTESIRLRLILNQEGVKDEEYQYLKFPVLELGFDIIIEYWAKSWSMMDFEYEIHKVITERNNENISFFSSVDAPYSDFGAIFYINSDKEILEKEINSCIIMFNEIIKEATGNLNVQEKDDSYITMYQFPLEIKVACEQYLVYFTQFLKDIGIEAASDLKNESGKVMFSVKPKDKEDGLERIKDALDIYLRLPAASGIDVYESNEIAVQQLQANIFHLKGQLALAKSALQLKDATIQSNNATIEALQLSNYQYKNLLDEANKKINSEEPLFKGIVKVKSYEKFGVKLDLAEIFRKLKRK